MQGGVESQRRKIIFLYPQNRIPRLHTNQRRDQTPTKESTGNSRNKSAPKCQGIKTFPWNGTILL